MAKLNPTKLGSAVALAFGTVHVLFDILSIISPNLLKFIFNSWFHGYNLRLKLLDDARDFSIEKMLIGFVTSVAVAWFMGFMIATIYNFFNHGQDN